MRSSLTVAIVVAVALAPEQASAQRNCTRGIPCGNTCIAAGLTCRVGTTPPPPPPKPAAAPAAPPVKLAAADPVETPAAANTVALVPAGMVEHMRQYTGKKILLVNSALDSATKANLTLLLVTPTMLMMSGPELRNYFMPLSHIEMTSFEGGSLTVILKR